MANPPGVKRRRRQWEDVEDSQQSSILNFFAKARPVPTSNNNKRKKPKKSPPGDKTTPSGKAAPAAMATPPASDIEPPMASTTTPQPPVQNKKKKKSTQLYLDFGQRSFGKQIVCPICNMLYVHGVAEDLKEHETICKEYRDGVSFRYNNNCRVVQEYGDEKIVEVRPTDRSALRQKVAAALSIVDQELGFVSNTTTANKPKTTLLYIRQKHIVGLASVELISRAYPLLGDGTRSIESVPAMLGVYKLWTHAQARKEGLATRLIDAARKGMVYGQVVPKERVAFSSPTQAGAQFARKYLGKKGEEPKSVLVYDLV